MKLPFSRLFRRKASSLVTTLLVLVVLSTIVVAFLQSMSIERLTARSLKNIEQAELAARAGYEVAVQQILYVTGTSGAFVTGMTNLPTVSTNALVSIVVIGPSDLTNTAQLMPLVSGITNFTGFSNAGWSGIFSALSTNLANASNSVDLNTTAHYLQNTNDTNIFRAVWVNLTNSSGQIVSRYAFTVMDEQARVNPIINNGSGGGLTNSTNWYSGPGDIQLTNSAAAILTPAQANAIAAYTNVMLTPETLAQGFATRSDFENVKHLLTASTNYTFDFIPANLTGGNRAGKAKIDINLAVANPGFYISGATDAADTLGKLVFSNLPSFQTRDPALITTGLASDQRKYVYRLAACIADYIDTDSTPSLVNGGEPAGKELLPYVTAVAERFKETASSTSDMSIESQCFVQVWNPYTQPAVLTNVGFKLKNRMRVVFGSGIASAFTDYNQTISTNITVRPNEAVVLAFPTTPSQTWNSGSNATNAAYVLGSSANSADNTTWPYFQFYVNGNLVDQIRRPPTDSVRVGGLPASPKTFNVGDSGNHYQCFFIPTYSGSAPWRSVGDPRASFLTSYDWGNISSDSSYVSSTRWTGRQMNASPRYQEFVANWVNRDYVPRDPPSGNAPSSINQTPAQVAAVTLTAADTNSAIAYLRNGPMVSIGELGNVFDPIHGDDNLSAPSGGSPGSVYVSAGGRTLRIGQPEYTSATASLTWNTNGKRAIELLDIFTVNKTNTNSQGYPVAIGRVNPNTASPEVLAAILAGIKLNSDAVTTNVSLSNLAGLATNIITNRPYGRLSDFYKFVQSFAATTNYSPAFTIEIGGGTTNLAALDRVREEAFGKLVQHFSIQSRTYRIFVMGQAIDVNNGKIRSTAIMESIVYLQQDPVTGKFQAIPQYQRFLQ